MKLIRWKIAILAIICSALPSLAGDVGLLADTGARVRNCTWCHGTSAQGYGPAPRLAGQRFPYLEKELARFFAHVRDNPLSQQYMWPATDALNPLAAHDLAIYFSLLPPLAANDGIKQLVAVGASIYMDGVPENDIVSCAACHGPNGEGIGEIPRLGGLSFAYLRRRLAEWNEGFDVSAAPPMPHIASKLSPYEIDALASYLSFVQGIPSDVVP
jgi:cytochrome c553